MKRLMTICTMLLLASCSKSGIEEQTTIDRKIEYRAYLPDAPAGESRTYVDENFRLRWVNDDRITIFDGNTFPSEYKNTGYTGANWASYSQVTSPGKFDTKIPVSTNVAVYPHSIYNLLDESDLFVTLTMLAEQTYAENSFGPNANTMIAITKDVNDGSLYFKNVGTYLNVRLWGVDQTVKSITITATGGEPLSGKAIVTPTYGGDPTCVMANVDVSPSVKLICEEAVTVNTTKETPVSFWIVLPPVTMEQGFTATVENAEGETQEFIINQSVTFVRNKYNTLTRELDITPEVTIPKNEIHYTATELVRPNETWICGATYLANQSTYDSTTKKGILKFDGEVTKIGDEAFYYCEALTSITIPESVTTIGDSAFRDCNALTSVTIPNSVTTIGDSAFYSCNALTSITIPNSVTTIGEETFYYCEALTSITIPESVTTIEEGTFYFCEALTSITIPESVTTIGDSAFRNCNALTSVTIPESVTTIEDSAFSSCDALTSVTIPNSVTTIGVSAFCASSSLKEFKGKYASNDGRCLIIDGTLHSFAPAELTSYTIPDGVTAIGMYAFAFSNSLISVTVPNSVTTIESSAFYNCSSLTSITISESVTTIGGAAFEYCEALTSITIPNSVTTIGMLAFSHCEALTSITIPNSVTTIEAETFAYCKALTSITIPNSVTTIGYNAFEYCEALTSITIPNSVTTIGYNAFEGCISLSSVTISESVTTISMGAFINCSSLTSVYCKATTPPTLTTPPTSSETFVFYGNASGRIIYVPASEDDSIINAYKAADGWKSYADFIEEYEFK